MIRKAALTILYAGIAYLIYYYSEPILSWFQSGPNPALVAAGATLMALFPVIPYPIVGGVLGAAYGPGAGGIITWIGSTAASLFMFILLRYVLSSLGERLLRGRKGVGPVIELVERNAFLAILFARMIPFVPSIIINACAAVTRVSFGVYALASALGKIPAMLLFVVIGDSLLNDPGQIVTAAAMYAVFMAVVMGAYWLWKRRGSVKSL